MVEGKKITLGRKGTFRPFRFSYQLFNSHWKVKAVFLELSTFEDSEFFASFTITQVLPRITRSFLRS